MRGAGERSGTHRRGVERGHGVRVGGVGVRRRARLPRQQGREQLPVFIAQTTSLAPEKPRAAVAVAGPRLCLRAPSTGTLFLPFVPRVEPSLLSLRVTLRVDAPRR